MGRRRRQDGPSGILLVDKPVGLTSFDVIARLRRALDQRGLGHTGTLDPLASGLLVVLAGRYTRLSDYLTRDDKGYVAEIAFGHSTTTDDGEGEVVEEGDASVLTQAAVEKALLARVGPQEQTPPMFSAISIGGERLYKKARRGETIEVPKRAVTLHRLVLQNWTSPVASVDMLCSKGTYVRALARDLGHDLGVPAHLAGLRRTCAGAYRLDEALTLDELMKPGVASERLQRGPQAVRGMPKLEITEAAAAQLRLGQRPPVEASALPEGCVALASVGDELIALVERKEAQLHVVRGFGS